MAKSILQTMLSPYQNEYQKRRAMFYVFPQSEVQDLRLLIASSLDLRSQIIQYSSFSQKDVSAHIDIMENKFIVLFSYPPSYFKIQKQVLENLQNDAKIPKNYTKSIFKSNKKNCYYDKNLNDYLICKVQGGFKSRIIQQQFSMKCFEENDFNLTDNQAILDQLKKIIGDNDLFRHYEPKSKDQEPQKSKNYKQIQSKNDQNLLCTYLDQNESEAEDNKDEEDEYEDSFDTYLEQYYNQQSSKQEKKNQQAKQQETTTKKQQKQIKQKSISPLKTENLDKVTTRQQKKQQNQNGKLPQQVQSIQPNGQHQQLDQMQQQIEEISLKLTDLQQTLSNKNDSQNYQSMSFKFQQKEEKEYTSLKGKKNNNNQQFQDMLQFCFIQEELISIYKNIILTGQSENNEQNSKTLFEQISSILLIKMAGQDSYATIQESLQKWDSLFIKRLENKLKNIHTFL